MDNRPVTIFTDLDGTLIHHSGNVNDQFEKPLKLLNGTLEKLAEWDKLGYNIIITTGRKEGMRKRTEKQLQEAGIFYDQLIMGIGGGVRVLINDKKPDKDNKTAIAINIKRNEGVSNITL